MSVLLLVAIGVIVWVVILTARSGGLGSSRHYILAVCPIALLFLTAPMVSAFLRVIRGFQQIAEQGVGGIGAVAPICIAVASSQRLGGLGLLVTIVAAAVLQARGTGGDDDGAPPEPPTRSRFWTPGLAVTSVLILPVALYVFVAARIPRFIMQAVGPTAARGVDSMERGEVSAMISSQLSTALAGGAILSVALAVCGVAGLGAFTRARRSNGLERDSWLVLAAALSLALWVIVGATLDIRAFALARG